MNLVPHFGAMLSAVLQAAVERDIVVVVAPAREVHADAGRDSPTRRLLASELDVTVHHGSVAGEQSVVITRRAVRSDRDDVGDVLAWLVTHPRAAVGNAWREALLRVAGRHGVELTKNQTRALVRSTGIPSGTLGLRLAEFSRASIVDLLTAVPATVVRL